MKFTFKTDKPTGRYKAFSSTFHYVKLKNKQVGSIEDEAPHKIRLMVMKTAEDIAKPGNNGNCPWKWITLKKESATLQEAKDFLNAGIDTITKKWELFPLEN